MSLQTQKQILQDRKEKNVKINDVIRKIKNLSVKLEKIENEIELKTVIL